MSRIDIQDLSFHYGNETILDKITMKVNSGDFVCILGESGCGKTTLLRLLAGLAQPSSGSISIDGKQLAGAGLDRGVVFQDYSLFPWLTNGKNLMLSLKQKFKDKKTPELKSIVLNAFESVGLDPSIFNKYPSELSGGMRQRCAICRAFALNPPVLLMDEPFGALDAVTRSKLQLLTRDLWKTQETSSKTIIFVTHDVDEALFLGNKIFLFGPSPHGIIYSHEFREGEKPSGIDFYGNPTIVSLRNTLIEKLNRKIHMVE